MKERPYLLGLFSGIWIGIVVALTVGWVWPPHARHAQDVKIPDGGVVATALVVKKLASPDLEVMMCPEGPVKGPMGFLIHDPDMWEKARAGAYMPIAMDKHPGYFGEPEWEFLGWLDTSPGVIEREIGPLEIELGK